MTLLTCFPLERFSFHSISAASCHRSLPPGCRIAYSSSITANRQTTAHRCRLGSSGRRRQRQQNTLDSGGVKSLFFFVPPPPRLRPRKPRKHGQSSSARPPATRAARLAAHPSHTQTCGKILNLITLVLRGRREPCSQTRSRAGNASAEPSSQANKRKQSKNIIK